MTGIVLHPLTALNGSPAYTADDYRHAVNPFLFPSDGTVFGCVRGVRYGSPSPLVTIDGVVVTVKPHCGVVCPWSTAGAYTYAITEPMTVNVADSTGDYKIVVAAYDPSLSHGETPGAWLQSWPASTPDSEINGLVLATVSAGVVSDVAPRIRPDSRIEVRDVDQLNALSAGEGVEVATLSNGVLYRRVNGKWQSLTNIQLEPGSGARDWNVWYKCALAGNVISLDVKVTRKAEWKARAWDKVQVLTFSDFIRPNFNEFYVPTAGVESVGFQVDSTGLSVRPFKELTYAKGAWNSATITWSV